MSSELPQTKKEEATEVEEANGANLPAVAEGSSQIQIVEVAPVKQVAFEREFPEDRLEAANTKLKELVQQITPQLRSNDPDKFAQLVEDVSLQIDLLLIELKSIESSADVYYPKTNWAKQVIATLVTMFGDGPAKNVAVRMLDANARRAGVQVGVQNIREELQKQAGKVNAVQENFRRTKEAVLNEEKRRKDAVSAEKTRKVNIVYQELVDANPELKAIGIELDNLKMDEERKSEHRARQDWYFREMIGELYKKWINPKDNTSFIALPQDEESRIFLSNKLDQINRFFATRKNLLENKKKQIETELWREAQKKVEAADAQK